MKPLSWEQVNLLGSCVPVKEIVNERNVRISLKPPEFSRCP